MLLVFFDLLVGLSLNRLIEIDCMKNIKNKIGL